MTEIDGVEWDKCLEDMADRSALDSMAARSIENLKKMGVEPDAPPLARAYAKGIPTIIATDTEIYLRMTLTEIAEEWCWDDPVDLLAVLAKADGERECSND
jgi:hypothetical protein